MKKAKRISALLLAGVMTLSMAACGAQSSTPNSGAGSGDSQGKEIVIKYPTYRVGEQVTAEAEKKIVDAFNEQYAGRIRVEVEELPSDQAYVEKMKVLAASNELPAVVEGKDGIIDLAIKNGQAIDLTEYVNSDPEYKKYIGEDAIAANTRDGKLYSVSTGNQPIGYFYNKDLFEQAGIEPAKTWDEFMSNLEALKNAGITPVSMMTGENCWTTNLLLASMIGTANEDGNKFMTTRYPDSYETPEVMAALENIRTILQEYTTKDALGGNYATAANHFLQGETAIIANGPWMVGDFTDTEKAKEGLNVGVAVYPNNGAFNQYEIGYMICASTKEEQDAAWEFLKFKTGAFAQQTQLELGDVVPLTSEIELSDEYKAKNPLVAEIITGALEADYKFNTLDNISYASVIETMSKNYPALVSGDMSVEDFAKAMTEAAAKNK